jgi:hypothetical protein
MLFLQEQLTACFTNYFTVDLGIGTADYFQFPYSLQIVNFDTVSAFARG